MTSSLHDTLQQSLGDAYRVERELGGGGMSRVFVAMDSALGRRVVVKVIAPDLAAGVSVERFKREIRVAARLQHPNIVPVLSAGQLQASGGEEGLPFYVMPFVAGESLRGRLAAQGALPVPEVVNVLRDLARALEYAHANGVVHRDIKPDNLLIVGGAAAVLDFGIAKALAAASTTERGEPNDSLRDTSPQALTQLGNAIGTPAYMAPEQATGDPATDHRADVYAFGCTAYELLAGEPPFAGRSLAALIAAHLTEAPTPIASRRPEAPPSLAALVDQCLAKDPDGRPATAAALTSALEVAAVEALTARTPSSLGPRSQRVDTRATIAVLPFANVGLDAADEYFADGLTDELITDLSAIRTLRVTARGAVIRLKATAKDARTIAGELGVRYVVTGTVRRAGGNIRVTATLHDAEEDATLWTDKINGRLDDVFAIQEQVAGRIAGALRLTLTADEQRVLRDHPVTDLRAYECLLQARHALWTFATPALDRARLLLENALAIVGDNARLFAALGQVHMNYIETGQPGAAAHLERAEDYAAKATALEPGSASALWLRGAIQWKHGELRESIQSLERARSLEPSNAELTSFLTYTYILAGQDERAREAAEESVRLDPLTPLLQCMPGFCDQMAGRSEAAIPHYRKFLAMDPTNPAAHLFLVVILLNAGHDDEAATRGESLRADFPGTIFGALGTAFAFAIRGRVDEARAAVTPDVYEAGKSVEFIARFIAELMALIGDADAAVDALEHSVRLGMSHFPYLSRNGRLLQSLHGNPRFERLLEVVRARWERGGASAQDRLRGAE